MSEADSRQFDALLEYLKRTRGFDFTAYKAPSLIRRVMKRMDAVEIASFGDYVDYLEVHPDEFGHLFDVILINVTSFFRDDAAWDTMRDTVLPEALSNRGDAVRVWTAGCASGEETYSIAMLLAEAMGRDAFRDRVKIYATDVDDQALNAARVASYTEKQVATVPKALAEKYFTRENDRFVFDKELRRSVIFGRHDLIQDAPISRIDILVCRNTLMYFHTEAQGRILARFHFALGEGGILFLGKAEMMLAHASLFAPVDLRQRIFRKLQKDHWRDRLAIMSRANGEEMLEAQAGGHGLQSSAFDVAIDAQMVVDGNGLLVAANERARLLFSIVPADLGRPLQDFELSYKPAELRSLIGQSIERRRPVTAREVPWEAPGRDTKYFDIHLTPLPNGDGRNFGVSISFVDTTRTRDLQMQLNRSKQDLETAYEELQSTNEELETTNEELQSTVEELETTNEELQSTNEELETMNEELQSTNEELQTINEELRDRGEDLNRSKAFLESILTGVRHGVVVVDRALKVLAWNNRAEDLWGLRADEVRGQNLLNLDIGLPIEKLRAGIRQVLGGESEYTEMTVAATNRRGRAIGCRVMVTPLTATSKETDGVIIMMDEQPVGVLPVH